MVPHVCPAVVSRVPAEQRLTCVCIDGRCRYHKSKLAGKVLMALKFHPDPRGAIRVPELDVQGKLYVRVLTGSKLRKVTKSAMDPTVAVELGPGATAASTKKTKSALDQDVSPEWNETLVLDYGPDIILASGRMARTPTVLV